MNRILKTAREVRWQVMPRSQRERFVRRKLDLGSAHWLFILGVNNSGTTLLVDLLTRHPEIAGMKPEGQHVTTAFPIAWRHGISRVWSEREDLFRWTEDHDPAPALRAMYDWTYYLTPRRFLMEKSPPNTLRSRWLQRNFAPASFVALVRSPYAVCEGMRRREGYDVGRCARHWRRSNEILLEDMEHLERKLLIRYEEMCGDLDATLGQIRDLLGLRAPFGASLESSTFRIHNAGQKQSGLRNMNPDSLARLSLEDVEVITREVGDVMDRLGYRQPDRSEVGRTSPVEESHSGM